MSSCKSGMRSLLQTSVVLDHDASSERKQSTDPNMVPFHLWDWDTTIQADDSGLLSSHQPSHHWIQDRPGMLMSSRRSYKGSTGRPKVCHYHLRHGGVYKGVSSDLEWAWKIQEAHCTHRYVPLGLCLYESHWKENGRFWPQCVFLEAGLVGSGSLSGVMSGKHYDRALYCHTTMLESLEWVLLVEFVKGQGAHNLNAVLPKDTSEKLSARGAHLTEETLRSVAEDESISRLADQVQEFGQNVTKGQLGKTAQLWISYMEHVRLVLQLLEAVKTNNFLLYSGTIYHMTPLFFSFDGQNYARYLSYFSVFLAKSTLHTPEPKISSREEQSVLLDLSYLEVIVMLARQWNRLLWSMLNPTVELVPVGYERRVSSPSTKPTRDGQEQHMHVLSSLMPPWVLQTWETQQKIQRFVVSDPLK